jgi:FKBP-type peptidyl-prolyl cis-trans isomerase
LLALAACGGGDSKPPAPVLLPGESPPGALPRERAPETPPALSLAEQEPGKPVDLGDGLVLQVDRAGAGTPAHLGSRVTLRYTAKVKDAETNFASTEDWDAPLAATIGGGAGPRLLPALERALTGLRAGCSAKLEVPPALGYGKDGPPGTEDKTLVFQIELLGVEG